MFSPFGLSISPRALAAAGIAALLGVAIAWGFSWKADAVSWRGKFSTLDTQAKAVLAAARTASDNPRLTWADTARQVELLGQSRRQWKATSEIQTTKINALGEETARLYALNVELRRKAEVQIAKRDKAVARLENAALSPGDQQNCLAQIRDATAALDLVFEEGL